MIDGHATDRIRVDHTSGFVVRTGAVRALPDRVDLNRQQSRRHGHAATAHRHDQSFHPGRDTSSTRHISEIDHTQLGSACASAMNE
jgi:hypothetical protein